MVYDNALALRVSLETGMRIGDVLALRPADLQGRTIRYVAEKTGKPDSKVISADLMKRLRQISNSKFVFPGRSGTKPRTRQAVWADLKKACKRAKMNPEGVSPHAARKTFAVADFRRNGMETVKEHLQHDHYSTTMIYAFADVLTGGGSGGVLADPAAVDQIADIVAARVVALIDERFELPPRRAAHV